MSSDSSYNSIDVWSACEAGSCTLCTIDNEGYYYSIMPDAPLGPNSNLSGEGLGIYVLSGVRLYGDLIMSQCGINVHVNAGVDTVSVVFATAEPDSNYGILVSPLWMTAYAVRNKATSGFTVWFNNSAISGGSAFDWFVFRSSTG